MWEDGNDTIFGLVHMNCDLDYTLLFVRRQKPKMLETTGLIFNNVLYFKIRILHNEYYNKIFKVTDN